ncbi:hypothetical protein [Paraflavitalea speifideaquila]|uniref:hypothetical protein n=1 Tax=Paraflavitalea speifideaquila TaxID=3076558 RepID=UPI0028E6CC77|nr:hypothetical protein [Paraflavitalea speifideiaquila]
MEEGVLLSQRVALINWQSIDGYIDLLGMNSQPITSNDWMQLLQTLIAKGRKEGIQIVHISQGLTPFKTTSTILPVL